MIKVAITAPSLRAGDNVSGIVALVGALIRENNEIDYLHIKVGRKDGSRLFSGVVNIAKAICQILWLRVRGKVDLLHLNTALNRKAIVRDLVISLVGRAVGVPIVAHFHGGGFLQNGFSGNRCFLLMAILIGKMARATVVLSEVERERFSRLGLSSIAEPIENAISERDIPDIKQKQNGTICFLGRIDSGKGLDILLRALVDVRLPYHLKVYGTGPLQAEIGMLGEQLLGDRFSMRDSVFGVEKWNALNESSIFVLPSRFEGLPMALLEALACGCLVIATDVGSIRSALEKVNAGFVVQPNDPTGLTETVIHVLGAENDLQNMRLNGRVGVLNNYSMKNYVEKINIIYNKLMG